MGDSRATQSMRVTVDGKNLASRAGTELADRSGLTEPCLWPCRRVDQLAPTIQSTHLAVAIADGADCLVEMASLREQSEIFGSVASIATAWRAVEATTAFEFRAIRDAVAAAWPRSGSPVLRGTRWCWTSMPRCRPPTPRSRTPLRPSALARKSL